MLVSAGFDAHERDPLGGMRLTSEAFAAMTAQLRSIAEECCGGRLVLVTEGGYDFRALADSLLAVVGVLASETTPPAAWPAGAGGAPSRGRASADAASRLLRSHWRL
jgi:acetoin utilization deacetylase AcuC-like enzyme